MSQSDSSSSSSTLEGPSAHSKKVASLSSNSVQDQSQSTSQQLSSLSTSPKASFPVIFHDLLSRSEELGISDVICWDPDGLSFIIFDRDRLMTEVLPQHTTLALKQYSSLQRQINMYSFQRMTDAPKGKSSLIQYFHPMFQRGKPQLSAQINRSAERRNRNRTSKSNSEVNLVEMGMRAQENTKVVEPTCAANGNHFSSVALNHIFLRADASCAASMGLKSNHVSPATLALLLPSMSSNMVLNNMNHIPSFHNTSLQYSQHAQSNVANLPVNTGTSVFQTPSHPGASSLTSVESMYRTLYPQASTLSDLYGRQSPTANSSFPPVAAPGAMGLSARIGHQMQPGPHAFMGSSPTSNLPPPNMLSNLRGTLYPRLQGQEIPRNAEVEYVFQ